MVDRRSNWGVRGLAVVACLAGACQSGRAQGFMVRPMFVQTVARAGDAFTKHIAFTNGLADAPERIHARLRQLNQSPVGGYAFDESPAPDAVDKRSSLAWTELKVTDAPVPPLADSDLLVSFKVPLGARGDYYCALLVTTEAVGRGPAAVAVSFQFLVPIIVQVQGPPPRTKLSTGVASLADIPPTANKAGDTALVVPFINDGETVERVGADETLFIEQGGRWRKVTAVTLSAHGLLPGHRFGPPGLLGRRLPKGHYRVECSVKSGGAVRSRTTQEFDYAGAAGVEQLAFDVEFEVAPTQLALTSQPGARGGLPLKLKNTSDDAVDVSLAAEIPPTLTGVMLGELKGESFSCAPWVQCAPAQFTLPAHGTRTVLVNIAWPATEAALPVRYANLAIQARQATGGSAGHALVPIKVQQRNAAVQLKAQAERLTVATNEAGNCCVNATYVNVGTAEWSGSAEVRLQRTAAGVVASATSTSDQLVVLPLGRLQCSATLDLAAVPLGRYSLVSSLGYGDKLRVEQSLPVEVQMAAGKKVLQVLSAFEPGPPPATAPGG